MVKLHLDAAESVADAAPAVTLRNQFVGLFAIKSHSSLSNDEVWFN